MKFPHHSVQETAELIQHSHGTGPELARQLAQNTLEPIYSHRGNYFDRHEIEQVIRAVVPAWIAPNPQRGAA